MPVEEQVEARPNVWAIRAVPRSVVALGPAATFIAGGIFAGVALVCMLSWQTESK